MTNEELAAVIQAGEQDKLLELWQQTERFVAMQARAMARKAGSQTGVTAEDLYQCGYLALVSAAETFSPDAGGSFLSWLAFYLKTEFAKWGGWRTELQRNEPLNNAVSLDAPVAGDEEDAATLMELQADPDSRRAFDAFEDAEWRTQLRTALDTALDQIPALQSETIRRRYFQEHTLSEVGLSLGVSPERARQLEEKALTSLRSPAVCGPLEAFLERRTPYHLHVGVQQFHHSQTSAVERIVLIRERLREQFSREHTGGQTTWTPKND